MDRDLIERRDFTAARRGYDPDEVDAHLRQVADEMTRLQQAQEQESRPSLAGSAAEQVRGIIEAAETSAAEIQQRAEDEARRMTEEADTEARELRDRAELHSRRVREEADTAAREARERAQAEASSHVARVQAVADQMLERARGADSELEGLLENLRGETTSLVGRLRTNAESLSGDLEQIRAEMPALRDAHSGAGTAPASVAAAGGGAAAADLEPEVTGEQEEQLPVEETPDEFVTEPGEPAAEREGDLGAEPVTSEVDAVEPDPEPLDEAELAAVDEPTLVDEPATLDNEPATLEDEPATVGDEPSTVEEPESAERGRAIAGSEGARLIALNMALNGTPRDETARYLSENFDLEDQDAVLDEVYARVGS